MTQLTFASLWGWVLSNTNRLTYDTEVELFDLLFAKYCETEDKHYSASRISCYKSGREHLPRKMVSRYWTCQEYIEDIEEAVLTVLIPCIPDLPGAIDQLVCLIDGDETLTRSQRDRLLEGYSADGGAATTAWLAYILRYSMLVRADGGAKAA